MDRSVGLAIEADAVLPVLVPVSGDGICGGPTRLAPREVGLPAFLVAEVEGSIGLAVETDVVAEESPDGVTAALVGGAASATPTSVDKLTAASAVVIRPLCRRTSLTLRLGPSPGARAVRDDEDRVALPSGSPP